MEFLKIKEMQKAPIFTKNLNIEKRPYSRVLRQMPLITLCLTYPACITFDLI